jgi:hypothetical protein
VRPGAGARPKNGHGYATGLVRCDGDRLVSVAAFEATLAERLLALQKGDPVSVSGRLQVSAYADKQGEPRAGLSVTTTQMMAAPAGVVHER